MSLRKQSFKYPTFVLKFFYDSSEKINEPIKKNEPIESGKESFMNTKIISLSLLSLGLCALAMAADYKSPHVGFRETAPANKAAKMAEFDEEYKVEGAAKTDRQIASEKEASDREPSSVMAEDKKDKEEEKMEPKPWMFRNKLDSSY